MSRYYVPKLTLVRPAALLLTAIVLMSAVAASAQTTAVLGVGGEGTTGFRNTVTRVLINAVENSPALELVDRHDLSTDDAFELLGCSGPTAGCMQELAATLEVDRVLAATIVGDVGAFQLDLRYYDAAHSDYLLEQIVPYQSDDERGELELRMAAVVSGQTVLRILSNRSNVVIRVDDVEQGLAPIVLFDFPPGRHVISATCQGCESVTRIAQLAGGRFYTETLTPPDDPNAVVVDDGPDDTSSPYVLPIVTISLGAVLLGTGTAFGILTSSTQDDFDRTPDYDEALDLADKGETYATLTNAFLISGAAVAVTGVLLLLTTDGDDDTTGDDDVSSLPDASPMVGSEGGGLLLEWRF